MTHYVAKLEHLFSPDMPLCKKPKFWWHLLPTQAFCVTRFQSKHAGDWWSKGCLRDRKRCKDVWAHVEDVVF